MGDQVIIGKLINPYIFTNEKGEKIFFENDLLLIDSETKEIVDRSTINLPYETPDAEIEAMVKQKAVDKAIELGQAQEKQTEVEWHWVQEEETK